MYNKELQLKRYQKNKVTFNFSRRMRKSLNGIKESKSWETLVNYSLEDLKLHLEKQFTNGMSWENYGEWHIDHIIPVAAAKTKEELINLCHYKNLQPLCSKINRDIKKDKLENEN